MKGELVWSTVTISCNREELSSIVHFGIKPFLKKRRNEYSRYQIFFNGFGTDKRNNLKISFLLLLNDQIRIETAFIKHLSSIFKNLPISKVHRSDLGIMNPSIPPDILFLYSEKEIDELYKVQEELSSAIINAASEEIIDDEFILSLGFCLHMSVIKAADGIYQGEPSGLVEYKPEYIDDINPAIIKPIIEDNKETLKDFIKEILTQHSSGSMFGSWIELCKVQFATIGLKKKNYKNIEVLKLYEFLLSLIISHLNYSSANASLLYKLVKQSLLTSSEKWSKQRKVTSPQNNLKAQITLGNKGNRLRILYLYDKEDWAIHNVGKLWLGYLSNVEYHFENSRFANKSQFKNYDFVWFGLSLLYLNYNYDLDKSVIAVHDPIELNPQNRIIQLLKKAKHVITISKELQDWLLREGIHSQLINTKSIIPYRNENDLVTRKCDIHSIFNPSPRKNTTLMSRLQSRCIEELKLNFNLKTGTGLLSHDDYVSLLDNHEIYVCTSLMEGGPLPAMDAMNRGSVVLTTPVGQMQNIIMDGKNGFICHNEEDFIDKIGLLSNNLDILHQMRIESLDSIKKIRPDELIKNQVSQFISGLKKKIKFDLGGIGKGSNGWWTVNLVPGADIQENILDLDNYCDDDSVDEFLMSHTYEHLPSEKKEDFIMKLFSKLRKGGKLTIIQTDIKKTLDLYEQDAIDFYCLRDIIFSPIDRRIEDYDITGDDLQGHQYMWGSDELRNELLHYGFSEVNVLNGGTWPFDVKSVYPFQENEKYFGVAIPNLKIEAFK